MTSPAASESAGAPERPRTLRSAGLERIQHAHAAVVLGTMAIGLLAVPLLASLGHPPGCAELATWAISTFLVGIGSSVGYHRYFTHHGFKTGPVVRALLGVLGSAAMQGSVVFWVALHRRHHENSDQPGDPHSPYVFESGALPRSRLAGLWHSYLGWTVVHAVPNPMHYARDMIRDPVVAMVNRTYFVWVALGILAPGFALALLRPEAPLIGFASGVAWGGFLRILFWHHMIWYITSLAHVVGRRDYVSRDRSTNSWLMALPTLGESWHNNHHAFPRAAILSFEWHQFDVSGLVVRALEGLGLVWDVCRPSTRELQRKSKRLQGECVDDAGESDGVHS